MPRIFKISLRQYNRPIRCLFKKEKPSLEEAHVQGSVLLRHPLLVPTTLDLGIKIGISGLEFEKLSSCAPHNCKVISGAFHSTKYSGLKFRVFYATNGTVFSGSFD